MYHFQYYLNLMTAFEYVGSGSKHRNLIKTNNLGRFEISLSTGTRRNGEVEFRVGKNMKSSPTVRNFH